jgi:hypothetical protein
MNTYPSWIHRIPEMIEALAMLESRVDCPCAGRVPFCANFIAEARNIGWSRSLAMMCRRCAGRAYHGSARILFVMRRS